MRPSTEYGIYINSDALAAMGIDAFPQDAGRQGH